MNKKDLKTMIKQVVLENRNNPVLLHEKKIFEKAGAAFDNSLGVFDISPNDIPKAAASKVLPPKKMAEIAFNTLLAMNFFENDGGAINESSPNLQYDVSKGSNPNPQVVERFRESLYSGTKSPFLTYYELEDLAQMDLYILQGYQAGFAIKDGDDIVAVHNNTGELRGLSAKFMPDAIKAGGTKLDHFDGFLSGNYRRYGFTTLTEVYDWNGEYKPEGWFYPQTDVFDEATSVYAGAFKDKFNSNPAQLPTEEVTIPIESGYEQTCIPIDKWVMYRRGMPDVIFRKF